MPFEEAKVLRVSACLKLFGVIVAIFNAQMDQLQSSPWVIVLLSVLAVSAGVALALSFLKHQPSKKVMLLFAGADAALFVALMAMLHSIPQPIQWINLEALLFALMGAEICMTCYGFYGVRVEPGDVSTQRSIGLGFFLPFLCALTFSIGQAGQFITYALLCAGVGFICLGGCLLWLTLRPKKVVIEEEPLPRQRPWQEWWVVGLLAMVLPMAGLYLNAAMSYEIMNTRSVLFPLLALSNGLLMLPLKKPKKLRLPLFFLKAVGFSFITYFAVVFLPLMPFGAIGLLVLVGVLLLTPAMVFALELYQIIQEWKALRKQHSTMTLAALFVSGMLLLPLLLGVDMLADRANFKKAREAMTTQQITAVNVPRLTRTLNAMNKANKDFARGSIGRSLLTSRDSLPMLDSMYSMLVFDSVPPGTSTVQALYTTYYNQAAEQPDLSSWKITQPDFVLAAYDVRTAYDAATGIYTSWVDLSIQNVLKQGNREFDIQFAFPEGCFITDYYLYVGMLNRQGLLAEKSAATMVYEKTIARRVDPGLLAYTPEEDALRLRVYPFAARETRKTGFQVMHLSPITLHILGTEISLTAGKDAHQPLDLGEHVSCKGCTTVLPMGDNPYDNALILRHNAHVQATVAEYARASFALRTLSPHTAFIVLETTEQETELRILQQRILEGEDIPARFTDMAEPSVWALLIGLGVAIYIIRRRSGRHNVPVL